MNTHEPDLGDGEARPPVQLVILSAGVSDPSSTRLLADRIGQKSADLLRRSGMETRIAAIELGAIAVDVARAIVSGFPNDRVQEAIQLLAGADAIIVSTPVYKAGISGLLKSFADVLDNDLLIAKPVVLAASAGTARHAMVVDDHMRPLFAFLRALPVPTSVFVAPEDWASPALSTRITRAATELVGLLGSNITKTITDGAWADYQHQFSGNAALAVKTASDVDFSTDLMRLAAGGDSRKAEPVPADG